MTGARPIRVFIADDHPVVACPSDGQALGLKNLPQTCGLREVRSVIRSGLPG